MLTLRKHHRTYVLAVWLATVVQLHLFFVAQLHHHTLTLIEKQGHFWQQNGQASLSVLPAPEPLDPACQIARQGSVNPASNIRTGNPVLLQQRLREYSSQRVASLPFTISYGRDPPLFS